MTDNKEEPEFELITGVQNKPRKVIIYGTPCIGKSSFAEQFPNPIMIQTEDAGGKISVPRLPLCKTLPEFYRQLTAVGKGDMGDFDTIIIDSLRFFEQMIVKEVCSRRGISSLDDVDYGKAYGDAMSLWYNLTDFLDRFIDKGMNVVLIGHNCGRVVKDARVDEYETTSIDLMLWGKTYNPTNMLVCWADCVLYLAHKVHTKNSDTGIGGVRTTAVGTGERVIYTEERPAYLAKNRFDMPPELPFVKGKGYEAIEKYLTIDKD